ncbi:MAG: hypothetical protein CME93_00150 [Hyphomonadaceae bacterium]|nr:hypothetical protein [Hyphomonadaceae bacterium]OUX95936.1 MAG: hypothetical protein CBB77_00150 [Hyphomonas sp. TMED17]
MKPDLRAGLVQLRVDGEQSIARVSNCECNKLRHEIAVLKLIRPAHPGRNLNPAIAHAAIQRAPPAPDKIVTLWTRQQ